MEDKRLFILHQWPKLGKIFTGPTYRLVNKVPRVFIKPMRPRWATDLDVANLQAKTVPKNFIWSESAQWLLSSSVSKDSRSPYHAHGHVHMPIMTITLHMYKPIRFQWTWSGVNQPTGYWVMASAKFGTDERTNGQTDREHSKVPPFFLWKGWETINYIY